MKNRNVIAIIFYFILSSFIFQSCMNDPTACFTVESNTVKMDSLVQFYNCSDNAKTYEWDFGDGTTSTEISPVHAFTSVGDFTVSLTSFSKGEEKKDFVSMVFHVTGGACCAVESNSFYAGDTIYFYNCSTHSMSYEWDFGDGTTSTEFEPKHVYQTTGNYTISLTSVLTNNQITNAQVSITITQYPTQACFTYLPDTVNAGEEVQFANCSTNAVSYSWDFGDGNASFLENPKHIFQNAGEFTVVLIATNIYYQDFTESKTIVVN